MVRGMRRALSAWPLVSVMGGVAVVVSLLATPHGSAVAPDSVTYVSTARNLVHGHGLIDFTGHRVVVFGPGFSVLLAGGKLLGIGALTSARLINAAAFGLIVVLTFVLLRRHVQNRAVLFGATALIALSTSLLRVVGYVASDPVFLVVTLCFLLLMEDAIGDTERRVVSVIAPATLVWAAFLLRYAGAALLIAGVLALVLSSSKSTRRVATRQAIAFGGLASLVPLAWVVRNLDVPPGEPLGLRVQSVEGVRGIVGDLLHSAVHLAVPERISTAVTLVALSGVAVLIGACAWPSRRQLGPVLRSDASSLVALVTFVAVYVVVVTVARKTTGSDLDTRILMPAWLPTVVVVAWLLDRLVRVERGAAVRLSLLAVFVIGLVGSSVWLGRQVDAGTSGLGFVRTSTPNVALAHVVDGIPRSTLVVSNDPWRVYAVSGRQPVKLAPMETLPGFSHRPMTVAALTNAACRRDVVVVWFTLSPASGRQSIAGLEDQASNLALTRIASFPKGTSYSLSLAGECR